MSDNLKNYNSYHIQKVSRKEFEEHARHTTAELPIALHDLVYPADRDILFYTHWHPEFEFFVMLEGKIELSVEDQIYVLESGDSIFINSNRYHSARNMGNTRCCFFALDFTWEFLQESLHTHFSREYIRPVLDYYVVFPELIYTHDFSGNTWQTQITDYLKEIYQIGADHLLSHELTVKTRIYQIWELLFAHSVHTGGRNDLHIYEQRSRLLPIFDYIKLNYSKEITLSDLSHLLNMSEGQFCRVFKEVMQISPFQYILRYRILQSCNLLAETDKKIGEIASLTGFNNISYYNRVFLNIINCTPKEYRNSCFSSQESKDEI